MIDEKKLIEELRMEYECADDLSDFTCGVKRGLSEALTIVKYQPKVGEWIPVKERLPEEPEQNPKLDDRPMELYLVDNGEDYPFRAFWNGKYFHDGWRRLDVLAWMPLPERYEEKEND